MKYVMKPSFKNVYPLSSRFFAVEMGKNEIKINKPVYLGQAILDLSEALVYQFHYDYMRPKYGSKVKRLNIFTGTLKKMWRKGLERMDIQRMKTGHYQPEKAKK